MATTIPPSSIRGTAGRRIIQVGPAVGIMKHTVAIEAVGSARDLTEQLDTNGSSVGPIEIQDRSPWINTRTPSLHIRSVERGNSQL